MSPAISVIIPAHNEEKYLQKTLESIKNQRFQDHETIIVMNGCTDKTEEVAKKYASEKIRYLSLPKPNVSVARNAGALNAKGKTLLFLDADTQLGTDSLQKINDHFQPQHSVATTKAKPDSKKLRYHFVLGLKNMYHLSKLYQGCSGALICRKEDFHKVGGYNPEIIVKEHRKLILSLKQLGKFTTINTEVTTSMRRFEQWGLSKTCFFWIGQWMKDKFGDLKNSQYEKIR